MMSYSNTVRILGASAAVSGLVAATFFFVGSFRGGAVLALACFACAVGLGLVMIRHQSRSSATTFRGFRNRLDKMQEKLSGQGAVLEEQALLLRGLDTQFSTLDSVPEVLQTVSGAVAATRRSVLENASSLQHVAGRTEKIRESVESLSKAADNLTVDVSAMRSAPSARPTVQTHQAGAVPNKVVAARPASHNAAATAGGKAVAPHRLSDGLARVLTLGRDPSETDIDGLRTAALLPGKIPSRATLPSSVVLVIDESGFSRGVWKSFGGSYDDYLLSELAAVRRLIGDGRVRAITLISDDTPQRFRHTRSWGIAASSVAEADQLLRAAVRQ